MSNSVRSITLIIPLLSFDRFISNKKLFLFDDESKLAPKFTSMHSRILWNSSLTNADQKSRETGFFDCHLSPVRRQMAAKNSVSNDF